MSSHFLDLTKLLKLVACLSSSWTKNLNSMLAEQLVTFSCGIHQKLFSFPQGYRKDNWLKVQRQSTNGSRKLVEGSNVNQRTVQGNQIHKILKSRKVDVESSDASSNQDAKSIGRTVLPGQRKCKKGAAEIGKHEASSLSIF